MTVCSGEPPVGGGYNGGGGQQQGGSVGGGFQQYGPPQQQQQQQFGGNQYGAPQRQEQSQQYGAPQRKGQEGAARTSYGPPGFTPGSPLGNTGDSCPPNDPQFNRQLVLKAYQETFGDHKLENVRQYFAEDYIQHNPLAADGVEGLIGLVSSIKDPPMQIDFKRVAVDGDLVWTHARLPFFGVNYAVVDIFRIQCGKIQEHWDVLQDTNLKMPSMNPHPFF